MTREGGPTHVTISLPAGQETYVKARAAAAGCSPGEYVRRLLHADEQAREAEEFERKLFEGLEAPTRETGLQGWWDFRSVLRVEFAKRAR